MTRPSWADWEPALHIEMEELQAEEPPALAPPLPRRWCGTCEREAPAEGCAACGDDEEGQNAG